MKAAGRKSAKMKKLRKSMKEGSARKSVKENAVEVPELAALQDDDISPPWESLLHKATTEVMPTTQLLNLAFDCIGKKVCLIIRCLHFSSLFFVPFR